jgi:hypothetical protein
MAASGRAAERSLKLNFYVAFSILISIKYDVGLAGGSKSVNRSFDFIDFFIKCDGRICRKRHFFTPKPSLGKHEHGRVLTLPFFSRSL